MIGSINRSVTLLLVLILISPTYMGCSITGMAAVKEPVTLGYCPTMSDLAEEIASKNSHISLQPFEYTSQALHALNDGDADMVLVGRLAEKNELDNAFEKRLKQGLTLVGRNKRLISFSELQNSRIHTYVSKELAEEYFPNTENILFHESKESAIKEGIDDIALIGWNDHTDGLELVIPVDDTGNKIKKFRIPVIYSYDKENIQGLEGGLNYGSCCGEEE